MTAMEGCAGAWVSARCELTGSGRRLQLCQFAKHVYAVPYGFLLKSVYRATNNDLRLDWCMKAAVGAVPYGFRPTAVQRANNTDTDFIMLDTCNNIAAGACLRSSTGIKGCSVGSAAHRRLG